MGGGCGGEQTQTDRQAAAAFLTRADNEVTAATAASRCCAFVRRAAEDGDTDDLTAHFFPVFPPTDVPDCERCHDRGNDPDADY